MTLCDEYYLNRIYNILYSLVFVFRSDFPNNLIKDNSIHQFSSDVQLNQQTVPFAVDNK